MLRRAARSTQIIADQLEYPADLSPKEHDRPILKTSSPNCNTISYQLGFDVRQSLVIIFATWAQAKRAVMMIPGRRGKALILRLPKQSLRTAMT
jgi:hypothetical protein